MEVSGPEGWLTVPDVAELLGITPSRVRRLLEDRALIGAKREGVLRVPAQLIREGQPLRDLPGTLTVLFDGGFSDEAALEWMLAEQESLGMSPADALAAGKKTEVRRLAQALAI